MAHVSISPHDPTRISRPFAARIARKIGIGAACVLVALILVGQGLFLVRAVRSGAWTSGVTPVHVPVTGSLSQRLAVIVGSALGPSDRGVRRFRIASVRADPANRGLSTVAITWAINDDVSAGTVGNGAVGDVYIMLRDIFTARLPVSMVQIHGSYPTRDSRGQTRETVVMRLAMRRSVAAIVNNGGWDSIDAQSLWPLVDRVYVNPQFQPLPSE